MKDHIAIDRRLTQDEFSLFARLSGDDNPIHVDPGFSARTRFGRTVAHGIFLASILRGLAGQLVPGGRQVAQELRFPAPTFAGDPMRFEAWVERREGARTEIGIRVSRLTDGVITCDGRATLAGEMAS